MYLVEPSNVNPVKLASASVKLFNVASIPPFESVRLQVVSAENDKSVREAYEYIACPLSGINNFVVYSLILVVILLEGKVDYAGPAIR